MNPDCPKLHAVHSVRACHTLIPTDANSSLTPTYTNTSSMTSPCIRAYVESVENKRTYSSSYIYVSTVIRLSAHTHALQKT